LHTQEIENLFKNRHSALRISPFLGEHLQNVQEVSQSVLWGGTSLTSCDPLQAWQAKNVDTMAVLQLSEVLRAMQRRAGPTV
jgi:hypothetical protein